MKRITGVLVIFSAFAAVGEPQPTQFDDALLDLARGSARQLVHRGVLQRDFELSSPAHKVPEG